MGSSGEDLLSQAASGDRDILKRLLKEHGPAVRERLVGKIPERWQSVLSLDDVMQQTYTDAFLNVDRFVPHGEGSFTAWLSTIAQRNLIDALRMLEADKRSQGHRQIQPQAWKDSFVALHDLLSAAGTTPSRHVARDEACTALQAALQQLPEAYRRAVEMFDLQGRPMEEVARALKRSPGAVYMVRTRAHQRLRELMGSDSKYFTKP